jgi:hypothetical protein
MYKHCAGCDFPMEEQEIAYEATGSLLVDPEFYCESCYALQIAPFDPINDDDVGEIMELFFDE